MNRSIVGDARQLLCAAAPLMSSTDAGERPARLADQPINEVSGCLTFEASGDRDLEPALALVDDEAGGIGEIAEKAFDVQPRLLSAAKCCRSTFLALTMLQLASRGLLPTASAALANV